MLSELESYPAPVTDEAVLQETVDRYWQRFDEACAAAQVSPLDHRELRQVASRVWGYSDWLAQSCIRRPEVLNDLLRQGHLHRRCFPGEIHERLQQRLRDVHHMSDLKRCLRQFRQREMMRIAWRDLAGWADLLEVMDDLTSLADACVIETTARLYAWQVARRGQPVGARTGRPQPLIVMAMGKMGGGELNFSSDIDVIFAYPEAGTTRGTGLELSNEEFFTLLARNLINALEEPTADGFVFRVDIRLRPFGDSGPLVMDFDQLEQYYSTHGRQWERYALIKARAVTGDPADQQALQALLEPFVFRRYLDFQTHQALRDMKRRIASQARHRDLSGHIKLGEGGIREVEFIAQVFQLVRGGRLPVLRDRRVLIVLQALGDLRMLPEYVCRDLMQGYVYLRRVENRLQAFADTQTHRLPQDPLHRYRLARSMGEPDWESFLATLQRVRARIHDHFEQVFAAPQAEGEDGDPVRQVWLQDGLAGDVQEKLRAVGVDEPGPVVRVLEDFEKGFVYRHMGDNARALLVRLVPLVLQAVLGVPNPHETLQRLFRLVESVGRRPTYLALLTENPIALSQLVRLCSASTWVAGFVADHPLLLDDLLDPRTLYRPLDKAALQADLAARLDAVGEQDLEQQMEALRHFKQTHELRVAAADIVGELPLMKVSDRLTEIAEVVLEQALRLSWRHVSDKYRVTTPSGRELAEPAGFAIVAYGKFGGIELSYGSDLDLVFLYDPGRIQVRQLSGRGESELDEAVFFSRLAQRLIHLLSTRTLSGELYEVDTRLRPSGASGLLVSSMAGFRDYQRHDAWTWEHQALVRARFVAGDAQLGAQFAQLRQEILCRPRDERQLRSEVVQMRARMRAGLGGKKNGVFHIKQDPGGIADIEFLVQYEVLRWAHDFVQLTRWTDNIRILETLVATGRLAKRTARVLSEAYQVLRAKVHRLTLGGQPPQVEEAAVQDTVRDVRQIWQHTMERQE